MNIGDTVYILDANGNIRSEGRIIDIDLDDDSNPISYQLRSLANGSYIRIKPEFLRKKDDFEEAYKRAMSIL